MAQKKKNCNIFHGCILPESHGNAHEDEDGNIYVINLVGVKRLTVILEAEDKAVLQQITDQDEKKT